MSTISILKGGRSPAHQLINGVFGRYDPDAGVLKISPALQRIYLLSLQPEISVQADDLMTFEVEDGHQLSIRANLTAILGKYWDHLYGSRAQMSGMLEGMLRAEQQQVQNHCKAIIDDLLPGQKPTQTAVQLRTYTPQTSDEENSEDTPDPEAVNFHVKQLFGDVVSAKIDTKRTERMGDPDIDMHPNRTYVVDINMTLPLYGDEEARAAFTEKILPALVRHGLCDEIPAFVSTYQSYCEDQVRIESPRADGPT